MKTRLKAKHGMRRIKSAKRADKPVRVRVGILSASGVHPKATSGQTLAEVAFWNELGTDRIPPRPFLSTSVREHDHYKGRLLPALLRYIKGHKFVIGELNLIGLQAASDVKAKILEIMVPPNALSTQRRKADKAHVKETEVNNPLIDSGSMRAAIAHEVV